MSHLHHLLLDRKRLLIIRLVERDPHVELLKHF